MKSRWAIGNLGTVSAITYGYTESATSEPVGPRFLRITDLQNDRVEWEQVPYCRISPGEAPKYLLASGDIVFARTGATTGKSFLVRDPPLSVFASYLIRLRLHDRRLLPDFVSLFFQSPGYWSSIREGSSGSAQGGFNATKLGALSIPIPPLPEQRRIIGILGEAFEGIATAKANAEKNLQNARALFESLLQSSFAEHRKGWESKRLGDVCQTGSGGTPLKSKKQFYEGGTIPWLLSGEVGQGEIRGATHFITQKGLDNSSARVFPQDTVLVAMYGATAGQVGILRMEAATNQAVCGVLPNDRFVPEFLFYFLLSRKRALVAQAAGNAQPNISQIKIRNTLVPLLPLRHQRSIVELLDSLRDDTQRLISVYISKLATVDALRRSLLHRAFSGQI